MARPRSQGRPGPGELMTVGIGPHGPTGPAAGHRVADGGGTDPGDHGPWLGPAPTPAAREALAVIASVEGIGPVTLERLIAAFGGPEEVLAVGRGPDGGALLREASRGPDERWPSMRLTAAEAIAAAARDPGPILAAMGAAGVHVLLLEDPSYPRRLRHIALPPRLLFVRGDDTALESANVVAVVGTRRPSDEGRRTAARIGAALARAGALVVSGLALGIDGAAHAAVVGEGGRTVAVIGGGHDRLFPAAHDRLGAAIVEGGGAVISEHAPGVRPSTGTFPRRNRVISGLADAVVVVEAGVRSGALLTAAWALEQGRECFLVPGSIEAPTSAGCLAWLRDYAGLTRIVAGVPQLLEDLGLDGLAAFPSRAGNRAMEPPAGAAPRSRPDGAGLDGKGANGPGPDRNGPDGPGTDASSDGAMRPGLGAPAAPSVSAVALDVPERERRLLIALDRGATSVDELAAATALSVGAVLGGLTGLEALALVEESFGRYRIPPGATSRAGAIVDPAA